MKKGFFQLGRTPKLAKIRRNGIASSSSTLIVDLHQSRDFHKERAQSLQLKIPKKIEKGGLCPTSTRIELTFRRHPNSPDAR